MFRPLAVASVLLLAHAMLPAFAQETASPAAAAPAPPAPKASSPAAAAINTKPLPPKQVAWSFDGPFGTFDRGALQRGFQVYKDVCSACHALNHIAFRNLAEPGGPGFSPEQVKALAASYRVPPAPTSRVSPSTPMGSR